MHGIYQNRAMFRETPAWHDLGIVVPADEADGLTLTDAFGKAKIDFEIMKRPLYVLGWGDQSKNRIRVPGSWGVVRGPSNDDPDFAFLGTCKKNWTVTSNEEVARYFDDVTGKGSPLRIETVGALHDGSRIFFSFRGQDYDIGGDQMKSYLVGVINHRPGDAHKIFMTDVRVVCANTQTLAEKTARLKVTIPHVPEAEAMIRFSADIIGNYEKQHARVVTIFEQMAAFKITDRQLGKILVAAYPEPRTPKKVEFYNNLSNTALAELEAEPDFDTLNAKLKQTEHKFEVWRDRMITRREEIRAEYHKYNDEFPATAGTTWAAWNAVTGYEDNRKSTTTNPQGLGVDVLMGPRARVKAKAFTAALKIANINAN